LRNDSSPTSRQKFAEWLFVVSGILHALVYPISTIAIILGFWRLGFWHGLVALFVITILSVVITHAIAAVFAAVIRLLDPLFFS
jgi:hypothetical protein